MQRLGLVVAALAVAACAEGGADGDTDVAATDALGPPAATIDAIRPVVPGPGLPPEVAPLPANNNLDVARWQGRVWLAVRSAPSHFASSETRMIVLSSDDEVTWRSEGELTVGSDLREPQLVPVGDALHLYVAKLGSNPADFEPGGVLRTTYQGDGTWSPLEPALPDGMIAWRIKPLDGRWALFGYVGGGGIYDPGAPPVELHFLGSEDGLTFGPWASDPVVQRGGGSETDGVLLDDGSLVAVVRNEKGDETGFGSKVCTAPADALDQWTCEVDPRKYDSPLMFRSGGRVWLVARRHLANDGAYDLGNPDLPLAQQGLVNQAAYWNAPKRCAIWTVDPATRSVAFVTDLPSRGDTCFGDALDLGDGRWAIYNYSNDIDGPDWNWNEGQGEPSLVYRVEVTLE